MCMRESYTLPLNSIKITEALIFLELQHSGVWSHVIQHVLLEDAEFM